jgi:hypothetical protein
MDETGVPFDMPAATTVEFKGTKHVPIKSTNNANSCTVFLACAMDGSKLKPLIVFKGKPGGRIDIGMGSANNGYDKQVVLSNYLLQAVTVQENNYCDESIMLIWIEKCLKPYLQQRNRLSIFMMDNFSAHLPKSIRNSLAKLCALQVMLPPNMTSRVQVLDVGLNKPFKSRLQDEYDEFLLNSVENNVNPKIKITREIVSKWVSKAWTDIPASVIKNTSRSIGFTDPE